MTFITVQILRFVDDHQPGFVECSFADSYAKAHFFIEKVPVVTQEPIDATTAYPIRGVIACEIESIAKSSEGENLLLITTERPHGVFSCEGNARFWVRESDITQL